MSLKEELEMVKEELSSEEKFFEKAVITEKFVKKYKPDIYEKDYPIFDGLISYAIKYYNDVIKQNKKYKKLKESLWLLLKKTY